MNYSQELQTLQNLPEEDIIEIRPEVEDDLFVDTTPVADQQIFDATISSQIIDLMHGALDTVEKYNNFKSYLLQAGKDELIPVIDELLSDAGNHVGVLEGLLKQVSPAGYEMETGEKDLEKLV